MTLDDIFVAPYLRSSLDFEYLMELVFVPSVPCGSEWRWWCFDDDAVLRRDRGFRFVGDEEVEVVEEEEEEERRTPIWGVKSVVS